MNEEIKNKLISKLKICYRFFSSLDRSKRYGFLFGEDKHSLIVNGLYVEHLAFDHYWGPSNDIFIHKVCIETLLYKDDYFRVTEGKDRRTTNRYGQVVPWVKNYSFQNENLELDWEDFFKNMDMFILKYI